MLDPRTKFLATIGLIITTFLIESFWYFFGIAGLLMLVFLLSKTPLKLFFRNVLLLAWLLILTFFTHVWGYAHESRFITETGVGEGILAIAQLVVVIGWVTILGFSASPLEIVTGLEQVLRPLRRVGIPIHKLSIVTMLSIRFIPILFEERQYLFRAYIARGMDINKDNILSRLKNFVLLVIPLFNSMLRRVEYLTLAMESRAFRAQADRTSLREFRMRFADYLVLGGTIAILLFTQVVN